MDITKDFLINNGWNIEPDAVAEKLTPAEKEDIEKAYGNVFGPDYTYDYINEPAVYYICMRWNLSNTVGRNWVCHIDNELHETVACVDIQTTEHFNKLMDLMDIKYRL